MLLLLGALSLYSCQDPAKGTGIVTIDPDGGGGGDDVRIPDYPDDYSEIASWGDHGKWNLANVHDPSIAYYDGYYYLFMAYDALEVPYNTRVVRSENIEGPYYDITGRDCSAGQGDCYPIVTHPYRFSEGPGWVGFSHCCIFQEEISGDWFYASQARLPAGVNGNQHSNALMMGHVRRLVWCPSSPSELDDLWPVALPERYAGLPGTKVTRDELVGVWEHIDLGYDYGVQRSSEELSLKEDGTMAAALLPGVTLGAQDPRADEFVYPDAHDPVAACWNRLRSGPSTRAFWACPGLLTCSTTTDSTMSIIPIRSSEGMSRL